MDTAGRRARRQAGHAARIQAIAWPLPIVTLDDVDTASLSLGDPAIIVRPASAHKRDGS